MGGLVERRWKAWGKRPFQWTMVACIQFVVLTTIAMVVYPDGSRADPTGRGYSFFNNFFSELGLAVTRNGTPNTPSMVLFITALTVAGLGLVMFFVAALQFFWGKRALRVLSILGSVFGVISGLCYVGVAWTPADLAAGPHGQFTLWAFQAYLVAAVFYAIATLLNRSYPKVYALVYVAFAVLLAGYVWLMMNGPGLDTARGVMIQATGQKIIVYAAIVCMFIQSHGAARLRARGFET
jgi:hypothetical protein